MFRSYKRQSFTLQRLFPAMQKDTFNDAKGILSENEKPHSIAHTRGTWIYVADMLRFIFAHVFSRY